MVRHHAQQGHKGKGGGDVEPLTKRLEVYRLRREEPISRLIPLRERDRECGGATRDEPLLVPEQRKQLNFPAT